MPRNSTQANTHPNVAARILPHSDEAEQALLSCVLIDEDAPITILSELKADDFYQPQHKEIFQAMLNLYNRDRPIDFVTLVQEVEEMGISEKIGGVTYISSLSNYVPAADNYTHYLEIVKKDSLLRQLIASSQSIMDKAYSIDADDQALGFAESEIFRLSEKNDRGSMIPMSEAVERAVKTMDDKQKNPTEQNTIPIPFAGLNEMLGGFHNSDLVLIAARPGQGKTSLGMNLISHAALDKSRTTLAGKPDPFRCAVFSLEMSAEQIATRLLCSVAKVSMNHVKNGTRTPEEIQRIVQAQNKLRSAKIFVDDSALTTPIEILSKCRRLKRTHGLDLVMVDYLQLMHSGKRVESRQQEVSEITRTMKIAAKELDVPILLLSQMSRDIEKRDDKRPQMSDLRESGAIEQDADIIVFLYREHDPQDQTVPEDERTKCDIIVAKHRNGETGKVTVRWHGEYTTFEDLNQPRRSSDENYGGGQRTSFVMDNDAPVSDNAPDIPPVSDGCGAAPDAPPFDVGEYGEDDAPSDAPKPMSIDAFFDMPDRGNDDDVI